jgi:hypothetical protein
MISLQHEASTPREPQRLELVVIPGKSLSWIRLGIYQLSGHTF